MTTTAAESGASSLANPTASANGLGLCFPDGTHVLRDTSFTIGINEFVAVVGPSGCGKSTLLRVMSGLLQPTSGSCSTYNQEVGFVFQDSTLLPWRTALQNVELFLQLQGVPKAQRRLQAKEAL
ncbi:MAG: ABC transporter ATP-binding protein, partial [Actinobacteria bacterium]